MFAVRITHASRRDAEELISSNIASSEYHAPWVTPFTDQAGFDAWLGRTIAGPNVSLIAREVNSNGIAGVININEIVMGGFQSAYLGYYGVARFARKGLMADALALAINYAFVDLGLHRLEANVQPGNIASLALIKKLRFTQEGVSKNYLRINGEWRDHERWALVNASPDALCQRQRPA